MENPKEMWEVLVPVASRDGREHPDSFHQIWDQEIEKIAGGGMTLSPPAKGRWSHGGERFDEHMIPVRVICTEEQINAIIDFTLVYYDQIAVLAYRISDRVILRHRDGK